jgi:hypothetical protein
MNDLNPSSPSTPAPSGASEVAELKELCAELRWQTHTSRIALVVVAALLAGFFWLEVRRNNAALQVLRPQATQVAEASKVQDPIATKFVGQLIEYSKTHADFAAVLNKYGIRPAPGAATATAPVSAAVPATAPKK